MHGMSLVSGDRFRSLMRNIASSVAVITTSQGGRPHGMTATAVCSVSAEPATILIVVNRSTRSHPIIFAAGSFAVNVLADHQHDISGRFSAKLDDPFDGIACHLGSNGNPIIEDVAAWLECAVVDSVDVGTHTIFIGQVIDGDVSRALPLVYHEGSYKSLARARHAV